MTPICNIKLIAKKPCRLPFPNKEDTSLGTELKRRRLTLGWTQKETAEYFNILKDSYQKWEWNENKPQIQKMKKAVEFLGYNFWNDGSNSLANQCLLYRIEYGLIREELGNKISVSSTTIERIEKGDDLISSKTISLIKRLLENEKMCDKNHLSSFLMLGVKVEEARLKRFN